MSNNSDSSGTRTYLVNDAAASREVSPLVGDYREEPVGDDDRGYAEINCPSCEYSIPAWKLVLEGGATCPGCERNVRLHVTSHDVYPEWRNIPAEEREVYR